jgi:flagellar basal-body rod modification protein FlgD
MSTSSVDSKILQNLVNSYKSSEKEEESSSTDMGTEQFMTLLLAQLKNQNPLDPTDTSQFTDQLAQFSQVEQLTNLNKTVENAIKSVTDSEDTTDVTKYVGMQVTGEIDTMTVKDGSVSSGYYNLEKSSEVYVLVYNEDGDLVATQKEGQTEAGSHLITWDGTNSEGKAVDDGTYTYKVFANSGSGYKEVSSTVTGAVSAVSYQNGKGYLVVGGLLMDPSSVTTVTNPSSSSDTDNSTSIMEYLGRKVSTNYPIIQVEDGAVTGTDLTYHLEKPEAVTVTVYNANDEAVATIEVSAEDAAAGNNSVSWDGLNDAGSKADDGLYYYTVKTASGESATTPVSGEVTSIRTVNGTQYLELGDSGRLVAVTNVTKVE